MIAIRERNSSRNEEVKSSYAYHYGYKPKGIIEQANRLRELFPGLDSADLRLAEKPLPEEAEGRFAIPRWTKIAPTYGLATEKVLAMINQIGYGKFHNYRDGELSPGHLRQHERSALMFQKLSDQQKYFDIIVVPGQFGFRHRGRSVRRARAVFNGSEFGLGAFAVGIMLLTHPDRLMNCDDLWIDCAGDEYSPGASGRYEFAPLFFYDRKLKFFTCWFGNALDKSGSASGFDSR
jgi:hypothetical protein